MIALRPAQASDVPFVHATQGDPDVERWVLPWTPDEYAAAIDDPDTSLDVIESDGRSVGFVLLRGHQSGDGAIELVRIATSERGAGYGRAALGAVISRVFEELEARQLWLDVFVENRRARHLYRTSDFRVDAILVDAFPRGDERLPLVKMVLQPGVPSGTPADGAWASARGEWARAMESGDPRNVAALLAADGRWKPPHGAAVHGPDELVAWLSPLMDLHEYAFAPAADEVGTSDGGVTEMGVYASAFRPRSGGAWTYHTARYRADWGLTDGKWKIIAFTDLGPAG